MKKLFFLASALLCGAISVGAVDYLVQTGKDGDGKWTDAAITALGVDTKNVIDLSKDGATLPTTGEIWFAAGKYEFKAQYAIAAKAKLYGSFAGTETSVEARALVSGGKAYEFENPTIFNVVQPTGENTTPLKLFPDGRGEIVLNGLTIQGSSSTGTGNDGGALKMGDGSVVSNCQFKNNVSLRNGGAVIAYDINATIENSYFEGNSATGRGGAIEFSAGATSTDKVLIIRGCTFVSNQSLATSSAGGGAIYTGGASSVTISGNIFCNNTSKYHGAAIHDNVNNTSVIVNNLVYNNSALGTAGITVIATKPLHFSNNTIVNNIGNVYFIAGTSACDICNNVVYGNLNSTAEDAKATSFSFAASTAVSGVYTLNNYLTNSLPTDGRCVTVKAEGDTDMNVISSANPGFKYPTSFVGATEDSDQLKQILAAKWNIVSEKKLIDAGVDLTYITTDILNAERSNGGFDIGAYELTYEAVSTAIENTEKTPLDIQAALQAGEVYNLLGQRVGELQAGNIYIVGGQKILMR